MQNFTLGFGVWMQRLVGKNPLVRRSDRVETATILLAFVVAVLAVPVAGAVATAVHDDLAHTYAVQRSDRTEVAATVTEDSVSTSQVSDSARTRIRWEFGGATHDDEVRTANLRAGDHVTIWVDPAGRRVPEPLTDEDAISQAVVVALSGWFVVVGAGVAGWAVVRTRLDHARYDAWDRELDGLAGGHFGDPGDDGGRTNRNA
ncbi:MAG: hypothetical protein SW019_13120 [Actinomycetota bacterium]|nr:hypothetical protein [Actinomycetota bacterium]